MAIRRMDLLSIERKKRIIKLLDHAAKICNVTADELARGYKK